MSVKRNELGNEFNSHAKTQRNQEKKIKEDAKKEEDWKKETGTTHVVPHCEQRLLAIRD